MCAIAGVSSLRFSANEKQPPSAHEKWPPLRCEARGEAASARATTDAERLGRTGSDLDRETAKRSVGASLAAGRWPMVEKCRCVACRLWLVASSENSAFVRASMSAAAPTAPRSLTSAISLILVAARPSWCRRRPGRPR